MTEQELDHLLSTTPGDEVTVDASVNPPHGQITKVTYTRAQVAALIAKVAPRMTEPTMSAETLNPRQMAESYARAIDVLMKYAYDSGHYERPNRLVIVLEQLFADGQARGRAEQSDLLREIRAQQKQDYDRAEIWQAEAEKLRIALAAALRARDRT